MAITNRAVIDTGLENEVYLELLGFSGGENVISEDHVMQSNEARIVKNWEAISLGGMQRAKGFNEVASDTGSDSSDLAHFHFNDSTGGSEFLGIINGDLVKKDGSGLTTVGAAGFTADKESHAADGGGAAWITNPTDNLQRYTIAGGLAAAAGQPSSACARIYRSKNRLLAEGDGAGVVYGSRVGTGNWNSANTWSLANDAFSVTLPNPTQGMAIGFPGGNLDTVFTKFKAYTLSGYPNVAYNPIPNSRGCGAPLSIAVGDEGVYFLSTFPTLGIFLWNGTQFIDLTVRNAGKSTAFVDEIDLSNRIYGVYRDRKYWLFYNESGSGVSYPNRVRVFNAKFGRWWEREVNSSLSDTFGYPALLTKQNNELYVWSSQKKKIYDLETTDDSDEDLDTEATYKTHDFSSANFVSKNSGKSIGIDEGLIKLTKVTATYFGTTGVWTLNATADRGRVSVSKTFDLQAEGDLINTTFTVNSSNIISASDLGDKTVTKSFKNSLVGRRFNFEIRNCNTGERPVIKKIKIHGTVVTED